MNIILITRCSNHYNIQFELCMLARVFLGSRYILRIELASLLDSSEKAKSASLLPQSTVEKSSKPGMGHALNRVLSQFQFPKACHSTLWLFLMK